MEMDESRSCMLLRKEETQPSSVSAILAVTWILSMLQ